MTYGLSTIELPYRRNRADALTAHIMKLLDKHICQHGKENHYRAAYRELFDALYNAGIEIITDEDRRKASLPPRTECGLTIEELTILENKRMQAMLEPLPFMLMAQAMTTLPPAATGTMTLEQARALARKIYPDHTLWRQHLTATDLATLCDLIISGSMKREIENAAYRQAASIAASHVKRFNGLQIAEAIEALIQPPAKTQGERK